MRARAGAPKSSAMCCTARASSIGNEAARIPVCLRTSVQTDSGEENFVLHASALPLPSNSKQSRQHSRRGLRSADYKDTVLADIGGTLNISNCGRVNITKVTQPAGLTGNLAYTLRRLSGAAIDFTPRSSASGTLVTPLLD